MTETVYDMVILGAGSGGYAAALRGAQLGLKVALIEADKLGGTCLHRGCVPTKALLHAAETADAVREAATVGIKAAFEGVDMPGVQKYKNSIVSRMHKGLEVLVSSRGIDLIQGWGRLVAADAVVRALEDADPGAAGSPVPGAVVGSVPGAAPGAAEEAEGRVTRPGVLVTLRTRSQGGGLDLDRGGYRAVLGALAEGYLEGTGLRRPDAVDVEAYCADLYVPGGRDLEEARADLRLLADLAHRAGLDVVASCHDLSGTPEEDETMDLLIDMQDDGADVVKLAATPHDAVDVARLLNATACAREILSVPLVTMSMGEQGAVTRVAGGVFGSALTFVLVPGPDGSWTPSAPGQLPIESVRAVHEVLGLHRGAGAGYEVAAGPRGHTMCP